MQLRHSPPDLVVDSHMTRAQALGHNHFPSAVLARMEVVAVTYNGFDHRRHQGQIVVDRAIADDVKKIFTEIEASGYPIEKVIPIVAYGWSDKASDDDNNTSGFNYRLVIVPGEKPTSLSRHSYGRAIDLNPRINPEFGANGQSSHRYDPSIPGTLTLKSAPTQIFLRHGWKWGGLWREKDYQHFENMKGLSSTS